MSLKIRYRKCPQTLIVWLLLCANRPSERNTLHSFTSLYSDMDILHGDLVYPIRIFDIYCPMWVTFAVRNWHVMLLSIVSFVKIGAWKVVFSYVSTCTVKPYHALNVKNALRKLCPTSQSIPFKVLFIGKVECYIEHRMSKGAAMDGFP